MTPALAYLRCSGQGQINGDTWDRQRAAIQKCAAGNDYEIVAEYRDEGVPGKTELENRPGLAACLERVENNGVKVVIIEIADRLARDLVVQEVIIRQFQKAGCRVISASGNVDLTSGDDANPTAKLIRQILGAVAEFDRCVTVLKLRAARERQKLKDGRAKGATSDEQASKIGRCEGRKCFGFRQGEAETLDYILKNHAQGQSPDAIANSLDALKVPTRYGKRWHAGTVSKILRREALRVLEG